MTRPSRSHPPFLTPLDGEFPSLDVVEISPAEPRTKTLLLSMSHPGWLRFRDPDFMVYEIIPEYTWVGKIIPPKKPFNQPPGPFFHGTSRCTGGTSRFYHCQCSIVGYSARLYGHLRCRRLLKEKKTLEKPGPWKWLDGVFKYFFVFTPIWGRFPIWLIFFRWVETTS